MGTWYRENRFLKRLVQFQRLEQIGPGRLEASSYSADYALWKMLQRGRLAGFKFERNKRILGNIVSFYCQEANLVIDLQYTGHLMRQKEERECDSTLQRAGIKVLRFHQDAILERPNSVKNSILEELYTLSSSKNQK